MKLVEAYRLLQEESKKIRYDMTNVNGGFSDGVEIKPGENSGVMNVSVNIYGGSPKTTHPYNVPPSIAQKQEAYIAARQTDDPSSAAFERELETYYTMLRQAISLEMVAIMKNFDEQAGLVISRAVANVNKKYQK